MCVFGPFRLDADRGELRRAGELVPLPRKAFELLQLVIERQGRLVSKEELFGRLWPNLIVEESNLTQTVYLLRKALGEEPGHPRLLVTVAGRGYRFGAEVELHEPPPGAHTISGDVAIPATFPVAAAAAARAGGGERPVPAWRGRLRLAAGLAAAAAAVGFGMLRWAPDRPAPGAETISLAVLPFLPLAGGTRDEALEAGMADTLVTRLSRLDELRVSSASLRRFGAHADPLAAGRALGVDVVLEGGIQGGAERVRVTARLLRVRDGATLWADKFDERYSDIFAVQDRLSERIATALLAQVNPAPSAGKVRTATKPSDAPEAHELYLQGRYQLSQGSREALELARQRFSTAVARYPNYALAHVGLAETYFMMASRGPGSGQQGLERSRAEAEKALALDDSLAFAHLADGAAAIGLCDWERAETRLRRALELEPGNWEIHEIWGQYLDAVGRSAEAIAAQRRAYELNPAWPRGTFTLLVSRLWARQYNQVIRGVESALEVAPKDNYLRLLLAQARADSGQHEEAARLLTEVLAADRQFHWARAELGRVRALEGRSTEALAAIAELQSVAADWNALQLTVAKIYATLGRADETFVWLDRAYDQRHPYLAHHLRLPAFDHLRRQPRFHALQVRMNLRPPLQSAPSALVETQPAL